MRTFTKSNMIALGIAIIAAATFSGCADNGRSFEGTHTMSGPQNTSFTVPNSSM